MRSSGHNVVLPKLFTPGRNRSEARRTDLLSPSEMRSGSLTIRGPASIIAEAKLIPMIKPQIPVLPANLGKFSAQELSRFIDKRLTDVAKSNINYHR